MDEPTGGFGFIGVGWGSNIGIPVKVLWEETLQVWVRAVDPQEDTARCCAPRVRLPGSSLCSLGTVVLGLEMLNFLPTLRIRELGFGWNSF